MDFLHRESHREKIYQIFGFKEKDMNWFRFWPVSWN